jgi:hypothetical protein
VRFVAQVCEHPLALADVQPKPIVRHFALGDVLQILEAIFVRIRDAFSCHAGVVCDPANAARHRRVASVELALFDQQHVQSEVMSSHSRPHAGGTASHHE